MVRLRSPAPVLKYGGIPERPKGADCKSVVTDFAGPNPASPTKQKAPTLRRCFLFVGEADGNSGAKRTLCRIPQAGSQKRGTQLSRYLASRGAIIFLAADACDLCALFPYTFPMYLMIYVPSVRSGAIERARSYWRGNIQKFFRRLLILDLTLGRISRILLRLVTDFFQKIYCKRSENLLKYTV